MSELLTMYYDECDLYIEKVLKLKRLIKKIEYSPEQVEKGELLAIRNNVSSTRSSLSQLEHVVCTRAVVELERKRFYEEHKKAD